MPAVVCAQREAMYLQSCVLNVQNNYFPARALNGRQCIFWPVRSAWDIVLFGVCTQCKTMYFLVCVCLMWDNVLFGVSALCTTTYVLACAHNVKQCTFLRVCSMWDNVPFGVYAQCETMYFFACVHNLRKCTFWRVRIMKDNEFLACANFF